MLDFFFSPARYISDLTPREREVAELIARGYTNPQIASALTITRETTKTHVSNILSKLGVSSRNEVRQLWARRYAERAS
ncbi:MAG TPA: LuxR C-terminal-related transcriptional regulator [Anaerolineae bacterium]|nr:LuxR C-terminal-related transcriptional regulator [Anaerolineae bacterium]